MRRSPDQENLDVIPVSNIQLTNRSADEFSGCFYLRDEMSPVQNYLLRC